MRGSPELQNGGLRALEEAWADFLLEAFFRQVWSFSVLIGRLWLAPGGVDLRSWRSLEVKGSPELQNGGLRALEEAWDDFLLEAFFCQVTRRAFTCSFSFNAQRVIRKRGNNDLSLERAYPRSGVSFLTFLENSTCVLETGP